MYKNIAKIVNNITCLIRARAGVINDAELEKVVKQFLPRIKGQTVWATKSRRAAKRSFVPVFNIALPFLHVLTYIFCLKMVN